MAPLMVRQPPVVVVSPLPPWTAVRLYRALRERPKPTARAFSRLMAGEMPAVVVPGGEFAVVLYNRPRQVARSVLLPPPLIVIVLLRCLIRFLARGVYPAT